MESGDCVPSPDSPRHAGRSTASPYSHWAETHRELRRFCPKKTTRPVRFRMEQQFVSAGAAMDCGETITICAGVVGRLYCGPATVKGFLKAMRARLAERTQQVATIGDGGVSALARIARRLAVFLPIRNLVKLRLR